MRKKLINDTLNASLKSYNDTSLKCHGLDYHCISLHTMTLILSVIFVNQNYDIHLKRHSLLIIVKPEKNSIFLKKGKTVISVENRKFSRSRMTKRTVSFNSDREFY